MKFDWCQIIHDRGHEDYIVYMQHPRKRTVKLQQENCLGDYSPTCEYIDA